MVKPCFLSAYLLLLLHRLFTLSPSFHSHLLSPCISGPNCLINHFIFKLKFVCVDVRSDRECDDMTRMNGPNIVILRSMDSLSLSDTADF